MPICDPDIAAVLVSLVLFFSTVLVSRSRCRVLPLPPGPPRWPIIGSFFSLPKNHEWEIYDQWTQKYKSDVIYYELFGKPFVILNSHQAAVDLFEKKSTLYADRPPMPMLNELCGWSWELSFVPYNDVWRLACKLFNQQFKLSAWVRHHDEEMRCTKELLRDVARDPDGLFDHTRLMLGKLIMRTTYGIDVRSVDDKYITNAREALASMNAAGNPGTYLVDVIPLLRYLPGWAPGAQFINQAKRWKRATLELAYGPFEVVRAAMLDGSARPSILSSLLEEYSEKMTPEIQHAITSACGTAYDAASETIFSVILSTILAMILFPDVQVKAQAQIDRVVGHDRFPDFSDQPNMPYIAAICKEALRWRTGVPLSIAHRVMEDDTYKGYHIPRGSSVVANSWAILRDQDRYPSPETFLPERYLDAAGDLNPHAPEPTAAFGFGRRACAGSAMAQDALWAATAQLLWAFDFRRAVDKQGRQVEIAGTYTSGFTSFPDPFACAIQPRSESIRELILTEV